MSFFSLGAKAFWHEVPDPTRGFLLVQPEPPALPVNETGQESLAVLAVELQYQVPAILIQKDWTSDELESCATNGTRMPNVEPIE